VVGVDSTSCRAHQHAADARRKTPRIPKDQRSNRRRRATEAVRPSIFDKSRYKRRNEVERTINHLKNFRAIATRNDKCGHVFHGSVALTDVRIWLRT
jgi:transposase